MNVRGLAFAVLVIGAVMSPAFGKVRLGGGLNDATPYVGASVGLLRYDESGLNTLTPRVIFARVGVPLSPHFAIEGRLGTGLSSDRSHGASVSDSVFGGGYVKGSIALAPTVSLYAVAGIAAVSLHRNFGGGNTTATGFSAGLGGDIQLAPNIWLNLEWTHLPGGTNAGASYNSNLFSAGVTFPI